VECAVKFAKYERQKAAEETRSKRQRDTYGDIKIAQNWCNKYIRLRDKGLPCISCDISDYDLRVSKLQWAAGHYMAIGAAPQLRFNEDNIHKQCNRNCNRGKHGNLIEYRKRLIIRIGLERVEALENDDTRANWTPARNEAMTVKYRSKYNDLLAERKEGREVPSGA
jgi:hypothetical protein